jgi:hypothetical protein
VGQILATSEKPHERPALPGETIANGPAQHRIAGFERVEDRALGCLAIDFDFHFTANARQSPQMCREYDPDHDSV